MADVISPLCSICNKTPTNHFCSYISGAVKCNRPVCSLCKVDVMGMQEDDPHRCRSHPLLSASQIKKKTGSSTKKTTLLMLLCGHCNKIKTANGCSYLAVQDDGSTSVCGRPICAECRLAINGSVFHYLCDQHKQHKHQRYSTAPTKATLAQFSVVVVAANVTDSNLSKAASATSLTPSNLAPVKATKLNPTNDVSARGTTLNSLNA